MLRNADQRIVELKLLENLAERTWADGVCTAAGAGQITVAASPPCDPDGPRLETYAENALKEAKHQRKNCVLVWNGNRSHPISLG